MKNKTVILIILIKMTLLFSEKTFSSYPQPIFEKYTLGMKKNDAIAISPSHKTIKPNTLGLSSIVFRKNKLKYALWFYKNKLQGILLTGKITDKLKNKLHKQYRKQFGAPGSTFEFGTYHYYWYFYRKRTLYTIEIKQFLVDIHYSISDTGIGPRP